MITHSQYQRRNDLYLALTDLYAAQRALNATYEYLENHSKTAYAMDAIRIALGEIDEAIENLRPQLDGLRVLIANSEGASR